MTHRGMVAILFLAGCGVAKGQPSYTVHDLGTLGGTQSLTGGLNGVGGGINKFGQVVGWSTTASGVTHAFRTAPNSPINPLTDDLGTLGGMSSQAFGINSSGQVVGQSQDGTGVTRSFRTAPNSPINPATDDLGNLGGAPTRAGFITSVTGINDSGQAVGESVTASGAFDAYRTQPNAPINPATDDLGNLGGSSASANGINSAGDVTLYVFPNVVASYPSAFLLKNANVTPVASLGIGSVANVNDSDEIALGVNLAAYVWENGTLTPIGSQMNSGTEWVNNSGQAVGYDAKFGPNGTSAGAMLYANGTEYNLNNLIPAGSGWTLFVATGINDVGQIAGYGQINGAVHAFRLDPPISGTVSISQMLDFFGSFNLPAGTTKVLTSILNAAMASLNAGNDHAAGNQLRAFDELVDAQAGKAITTGQAAMLTAAAKAMMQLMP